MTPNGENLHEILAWYSDAGIDCALLDEPVDRFAQTIVDAEARKQAASRPVAPAQPEKGPATAARQRMATPPASRAQAPDMAIPDGKAVAKAEELAAGASTLEELRLAIEGFDGCNLRFTARTTVFCDGNALSHLMVVSDVPGREEDEQGLPFVGKPGQLFDKMLASIGLDRKSVYISSVMPWRPPGNRSPSAAEADICRPFILRHIELARPKAMLFTGALACQILLGSKNNIMNLRGKWTSLQSGDTTIPILPTLDPNYLLRNPSHKRFAWNDLLSMAGKLEELALPRD